MRKNLRAAMAAIGTLALVSLPASGEEGMWTFDSFPVERMQRDMGWAPDQAWLDRVMAGTARLPGCSGSNVSARGLLLTNHHCVVACLSALSTEQGDYVEDGFIARAREEERRCPGLSVQLLVGVADVTQRIDAAAEAAGPEGFARARDAEIARIQEDCPSAHRCEVVTLYAGGRYSRYSYRRFDDVRLVFAPERRMAAFGGEPDNFNFPRYGLDFAFLRLYERGAPAATPDHLSMRFTPLTEDEVVLVAGNPGPTSRLRTTAELAFERDVSLPWEIASLSRERERLAAFSALGPDEARIAASEVQNVVNSIKGLAGRRTALADAAGVARVAEREADLQARVRRNRASAREVGDAWGEIARAQTAYRTMFQRHQLLEQRAGGRSSLLLWARDIVRGAAERQKPEAERLQRYAQPRLASVAYGLRAERTVAPGLEQLHLALWLSSLREHLGENDPAVRRILGGESPETLAQLLSRSRLADPAYRMRLWEGGAEAVADSDDPMVAFVRAWDDDARAVRARYVADVEAPVARAHERIARARFRAFGENLYPDTTFSPRISYGRVTGWSEPDGRAVGPFTRMAGLYERATGADPFALSQRWIDARGGIDPDAVVNVVSSTDVISGNSGSPLLDRDGRVAGAVFDGNMHSLGGEYYYDGARNRSISVAASAIRAALADAYGMDALLAELERR